MIDFFKAFLILLVTLPVRILFFIIPALPKAIVRHTKPVVDVVNPKDQEIIELAKFGFKIQRFRLPRSLSWFETPDQLLPGGLYEPAVLKLYEEEGADATAANWIGQRNVLHGFAWAFGKPATNYMVNLSSEQRKAQGVYEVKIKLGFFYLIIGHAIYRDWYSVKTRKQGFWAVPRITVRRA